MRRMFVAILVVGLAISSAAVAEPDQPSIWVTISQGEGDARVAAGIEVAHASLYTGGPTASVPARPRQGGEKPATGWFRIRSWKESDAVRVAVYAVSQGPDLKESETLIALVPLAIGKSAQVSETERYAAAPVTVTAHTR